MKRSIIPITALCVLYCSACAEQSVEGPSGPGLDPIAVDSNESTVAETGTVVETGIAGGDEASKAYVVGTTRAILEELGSGFYAKAPFSLFSNQAEEIVVDITDFYFLGGELSMSGYARENRNSSFILKGTKEALYGWVVLHDRNLAYEYTTNTDGWSCPAFPESR